MNFGLRGKMLVMLLLPVILMLAGLSFYSYRSSTSALDQEIMRSATYITGDYVGKINAKLVDKEASANNLASILGSRQWSPEDAQNLIRAVKASDKDILNVFVGYENRQYIETNGWVPAADYDPRSRGWYKQAVASGEVGYSDVYEDAGTKQLVVSVVKKIVSNGQLVGVVGIDLNLTGYQAITKDIKVADTGYAYLLSNKGEFIYHPSLKMTDNITTIENGALAQAGKEFLSGKPMIERYTLGGVERIYTSAPVGKTGWVLVIGVPMSELYAPITAMGRASALTSAIAVLLLAFIIIYVTLKITRPISDLAGVTKKLASGDLSADTATLAKHAPQDEVGDLMHSFHTMQEHLRTLIRQVAQATEQIAASSEELTASAEQSAQASNQVAGSITSVAQGSVTQLDAVNDTAGVVKQMADAIHHVAGNANNAAEMADKASVTAKEGDKSVEKAVHQIGQVANTVNMSAQVVTQLGERSKEIGQIVDTISGIAGQTNLLALNAAIEAARAGEQGRGFAVVAEEVRKLAEQSQEAAKQISELIGRIQQDTDKAVAAMNDGTREVKLGADVVDAAGKSFQEITAAVLQVSDQVREISAAIQQMSDGSEQIVGSVRKIERIGKEAAAEAQTVSAATEEQSASMEEIASSSQTLAKMAQDLQEAVSRFRL